MEKLPTKLIVSAVMPGKLDLEQRMMADHALSMGIPVETASEKMMERGKVQVSRDFLVMGTVPFVQHALRLLGAALPEHTPYPEVLAPWLYRKVWKEKSLRRVLDRLGADGAPVFIKPASGWKRFTGFIAKNPEDYRLSAVSKNMQVWVSEPIQFLSEWRVYVLRGEIQDIKFCDHGGDPALRPGLHEIESAVNTLRDHRLAPAGFVIDFGITSKGQTALIEMNDGFSFGAYDGVSAQIYWDINWARWDELVSAQLTV
ncbi:ATP-grasp domain-containing protein [Undibacterium sp. Di26W]|uniref:ATP-grasp domain-containing protein n=1 Tax=Undibacterium sp. Di26W TaxID=3413035 RepID=UPI003BF2E239